ncbi:protein of unknown function (plasmid) [Shinella sp. WSC3-e]|nr:hypothetical protein SHINE37_100088 [Rhizobiaceae bacterium]CAK7261630.1 protein of unknown function [Shinella sp. WSC3-e]
MLFGFNPRLLAEQPGSLDKIRPHETPVYMLVHKRPVIGTANHIRLEVTRLGQEK